MIRHEVVSDPEGLPAIMGSADLAITAAGISSLELACLGVPMLVYEASPNQASNVAGLVAAGAAINLGSLHAMCAEPLQRALLALAGDESRRRRMAMAGPKLIDGRGADRVAHAVITHLESACNLSR
jgi:spore coat polysaccharide biosynthesis predicted glycosyltransferase SpsG